jgi:hypothetical protein
MQQSVNPARAAVPESGDARADATGVCLRRVRADTIFRFISLIEENLTR